MQAITKDRVLHFTKIIGLITGLALSAHTWADSYTITDLGVLGAGTFSQAYGVNESGQVTGQSSADIQGNSVQGFVYSNGTMSGLGSLGGSYTAGISINAQGQIAGWSYTANNAAQHAFLYSNGVMQDLGTFAGAAGRSNAAGINASGQVTGYSDRSGIAGHAFLYSNGTMNDLGSLIQNGHSYGTGINDAGQVVGHADVSATNEHAFIYSNGVMTDIGTLGGQTSIGLGINNLGQVTGSSFLADGTTEHAMIYSNGVMTDLGVIGGPFSRGESINDHGQVVGYAYSNSNSPLAFLYSNGAMVDLNSLLPTDSGWTLFDASSINDNGQIVGYGVYNGQGHAYLMSAVPLPAAAWLFVSGLLGLTAAGRRRKA